MIGLVMGLAVLVAVGLVGARRWRGWQERRARPGVRMADAIPVERFDDIDLHTARRRCAWCGEGMRYAGETSRVRRGQRLRVVRLVCRECERDERIHFDVTALFH